MSRKHFRALLILSMLLNVGVMAVRIATEDFLPSQLREFRYEMVSGVPLAYIFFFDAGFILFNIVASLSLIFFRRWARFVFLVYVAFKLLCFPFREPFVDVGQTILAFYFSSVIEGVILALIYYSPIREAFARQGDV